MWFASNAGGNGISQRMDGTLRSSIVVRPNDRIIRALLLLIGVSWWCSAGFGRFRNGLTISTLPLLLLWALPLVVALLFLCWLTFGRFVITRCDGYLSVERRVGALTLFGPRRYLLDDIHNIRIEKRVTRMKGNQSTRYAVLVDASDGVDELWWFRQHADAEDFRDDISDLIA